LFICLYLIVSKGIRNVYLLPLALPKKKKDDDGGHQNWR